MAARDQTIRPRPEAGTPADGLRVEKKTRWMRVGAGHNTRNRKIREPVERKLLRAVRHSALGRQCRSGPAADSATVRHQTAILVAGTSGTRMLGGHAMACRGLHLRHDCG